MATHLSRKTDRSASARLRFGLTVGLVCLGVGCASAVEPAPTLDSPLSNSGWIKQTQDTRSIAGLTRIERWRAPGEDDVLMVKAERYVSGMPLVKGVRLIFQAEQRRWTLSLNQHLQPLESFEAPKPYLLLPAGMQRPVVWQGAFEAGGHRWELAIFGQYVPQNLPGVATEAQASLDFLVWRSDRAP